VRLGGRALNIAANGAASGASKLFVRRHDMQVGPAGSGALEGAVRHVRTFGPIQRAEVALSEGEGATVIEIDAPRDRELQAGDVIGLQPRRYRIFAAQD
jgi:sulfate/thiosulfate transport system ATP-binding protein